MDTDTMSRKPTIVFLDRETLAPSVTVRPVSYPHQWAEYPHTPADEVAGRIAAADIVITNKVKLSADLLAGAKQLKLIAVAATGTNNVDLNWCREQRLPVCNIRGYGNDSVPEHAIAMMLALRRNLTAYHQSVQAGRWQASRQFCYFDYPIGNLRGQTLGIIGSGELGQATARLAQALGMQVLFGGRKGDRQIPPERVPFTELLQQADIISLHCPLTADNYHLIGEPELARMKPDALLINTARGGLVDEAALRQALERGDIGGAGLDVLEQEPPSEDAVLLRAPMPANLLVTPHVAWASSEAMQALADQLIDNIEAFLRGEPRNLV